MSKGGKIFPLVSITVIFKMEFAKQLIPNMCRCIWVFHLLEHISCLKFYWKTLKSKLVYKSLEKEMTFRSALLKETKLVNASDFKKHLNLLFYRYSWQNRICYSVFDSLVCMFLLLLLFWTIEFKKDRKQLDSQKWSEIVGKSGLVLIHCLFCFLLLTWF